MVAVALYGVEHTGLEAATAHRLSAPGGLGNLESPVARPVLRVEHRMALGLARRLRVRWSVPGEPRSAGKMRSVRDFQKSIEDK